MKLGEVLKNIDVVSCGISMDTEITGVSCDSRKILPGCLFVAIKGFESDGNKYIPAALSAGAACVLGDSIPDGVEGIRVRDGRKALSVATANFYGNPASKLKIIGITGTNGKTTTTNLVKEIIEKALGEKVGLIGTNSNMIGGRELPASRTTPGADELQELFSDMVREGCRYAVMEVSSHALALDRVYGINFEVGAFTNLTRDHLDFHKTMEEYGKAKAKLFSVSKKGIVNIDDQYAGLIMENAKCPIFKISTLDDRADLTAKNIVLKADGVSFSALTIGKLIKVRLGIPGMFSVYNALTALAVCLNLGVSLEDAVKALGECHGIKGRAEVVPTGRDFSVLIDYAHTPDAVENIIKTVKGYAKGRVVVLFGCGGDRDKTKRPIMGNIATELADFAVITSDNPRTEDPNAIIEDILKGVKARKDKYKVIENRREAIGWAVKNAKPDDVIILAGKGHETYQVIGKENHHFDEREIVAEFLKK